MQLYVMLFLSIIALSGNSLGQGDLDIIRVNVAEGYDKVMSIVPKIKRPPIAEIIKSTISSQKTLRINGRDIHSAERFDPEYSLSTNETLAFVAYSSGETPINMADVNEKGELEGSIAEVWVSIKGSKPFRVTDHSINAYNPLLSNKGDFLTFTGKKINAHGFLGNEMVFLISLNGTNNTPKEVASTKSHEGAARSFEWLNDNSFLVFISNGNDGAKSRIDEVSFKFSTNLVK